MFKVQLNQEHQHLEGGKVTVNGKEKTVEIDETVKPTFEDGTTEKKVPGEGTYTIDENGKVTFTPEKTFTGQAKGVTVKRVDKNGTPVTAKYTPVVVPVTPTSKDLSQKDQKDNLNQEHQHLKVEK